MKTAEQRWTEAKVFRQLEKVFPSPAFVLLPQVRNGTGYARRQDRTADGLAVSVWPSRGLHFTGIEIKVSRSDWKRELAAAAKSVEIQQYCRYWFVAAPDGVVPVGEVPETWGLIEVNGGTARIVKAAPQLDCKPPDMLFVCAVLRAMAQACVAADDVKTRIQEAVERSEESLRKNQSYEFRELKSRVTAFEEASGLSINNWDAGQIGDAVKFVRSTGLVSIESVADGAAKRLEIAADKIREAIAELRAKAGSSTG